MQKKLVRFPYCALAAGHKVVALAVRALVYRWRGCPLHKLLVVRSANVYRTLHAVRYALKLSTAFDWTPESEQRRS
eukprot:COSAG02_NODE_9826_length_2081_cov_6.222930_2_plen_76_part_00